MNGYVIDVEESTEPEYYPPDGDLPSLELALEHARNQYCDCFNVKNAIITKATITLSFSMAMIALIGSVQFELFSSSAESHLVLLLGNPGVNALAKLVTLNCLANEAFHFCLPRQDPL